MSHEERNAVASIISNLIINGYFASRVYAGHLEGAFSGSDGLMVWARLVLWIIPVGIAASIIIIILFNILYAIATNTPKPSFLVDERDKVIGSKSVFAVVIVSSAALFLCVIALAFGWSAFAALNIVFFGFGLAELASNVTKMYFYRRGY